MTEQNIQNNQNDNMGILNPIVFSGACVADLNNTLIWANGEK